MTSKIFKEILESIPGYRRRFTRMSMDIASQIYDYMKQNNNMSQKKLAEKLGKKESEISKWLSGSHNFTIETIAKIEDVFNKDILLVPLYAPEDLGIKFATSANVGVGGSSTANFSQVSQVAESVPNELTYITRESSTITKPEDYKEIYKHAVNQ